MSDLLSHGFLGQFILVALVVWLGGVLDPASVVHGDGITLLRALASALLDRGLSDTHCE